MNIGLKDVKRINKELGGNLRDSGSLEFAISAGKDKSERRKLALLWRAILTDHPFDDANKRTVEIITRKYAKENDYEVDTEALVKEIIDISKNNITNLDKIERRIKYAATGN